MAQRIAFPESAAEEEDDTSTAGVRELVYLNTLLRLPQAGKEAGVSTKTLQRAYVNHRLHVQRIGARGIRIRRRDLLAWQDAGCPVQKERKERIR